MKKKVSQETINKRKATILAKRNAKAKKETIKKDINESSHFADKKNVLQSALNMLNKFPNKVVKTLPIVYKKVNSRKKNNVLAIYVNSSKKVSYDDLKKLGLKMSQHLKKNGLSGEIGLALKFDFGWLPSIFSSFGDFKIYNPTHSDFEYEQNGFNEFEFMLVETPKATGGASENNNCLYHCLKDIFFDNVAWADGLQLKKYLKLKFSDKVPITMIPQIENKQNCKINVTGDYVYTSTKESNKVVNLKLINEHYSLDLKNVKAKLNKFKVASTTKAPIIYDNLSQMAYNGEELYKMSPKERSDHMSHKTDYILVTKSNDKFKKTFEQDYEDFIKDANILLEKSNGIINMYKTGNDKITALNLFDYTTKHISPDDIEQAEANWINLASSGALIYAEPYEGQGYDYDVKSQYPSIQKSGMLFPVKKGEFLKIEKLPDDFFKYGVYRARIYKSEDKNINKLFRFNFDDYYTHFDLTTAKQLNLKIELILDDQPNFLYYERKNCLTGNEIFGPYINLLFELKQLKLTDRTKSILNILWGALSEKKLIKKVVSDDEYEIPEDDQLHSILRLPNGSYFVKHQNTIKQYKSPFARICPFIVSKGRANIAKIMEPYKDTIVKIHTDGGTFTEQPKDIKTGTNLGDLEYRGMWTNIKIINNSKPIGTFMKNNTKQQIIED
jgi:hypothetical protein